MCFNLVRKGNPVTNICKDGPFKQCCGSGSVCFYLLSSAADPDLYVFRPPGSFYEAKNFCDFLFLKNDINVASKGNKHKNIFIYLQS
jgi:hypothetical protein